jgi:hypothetical protein
MDYRAVRLFLKNGFTYLNACFLVSGKEILLMSSNIK